MFRGVKKLPVKIKNEDYIEILKLSNNISMKLGKLDSALKSSVISKNLIQLVAYNESVQSTKIEGTQVTFHEILEVRDNKKVNAQQQEVLNYKLAIDYGCDEIIKNKRPITTSLIKELHSILMDNARGTKANKGNFRKIQNFIGKDKNIENAVYIPVSANEIDEYMTNLEYFINGENHISLNTEICDDGYSFINYDDIPLLKMAICHAQFESIHPFLDGNGRLGRILIVLMALYYGIVSEPLFFVSEELEKEKIKYYNLLNSTRGNNPKWYGWIEFFLQASDKMIDGLLEKIDKADELFNNLQSLCITDSQKRVLFSTFLDPITTVKELSSLTKLHQTTVSKALEFLTNKRIIEKDFSKKRNVNYYNYEVIKIIKS